jgi:RNA polymerase sigma-70 factor, ECF subfamily
LLVEVAATVDQIEDLYRRRYVAFRNVLATTTGSYEVAADVVQDAFAQALRRRETFRGDGSLEAWVWRIAFRTALSLRGSGPVVPLQPFPEPDLIEPSLDPVLADALRALPERRRLVVFLRYFADLSYGDIAEVCGISEGTVAATLAQARAVLLVGFDRKEVGA